MAGHANKCGASQKCYASVCTLIAVIIIIKIIPAENTVSKKKKKGRSAVYSTIKRKTMTSTKYSLFKVGKNKLK